MELEREGQENHSRRKRKGGRVMLPLKRPRKRILMASFPF
jgi:hypothetical protein